jgi:hypothetical protein
MNIRARLINDALELERQAEGYRQRGNDIMYAVLIYAAQKKRNRAKDMPSGKGIDE